MLNRRSNFVLAAGLTLAVAALTAGSASAMGGHASAKSAGTHQTMSQPTMVKGISMKPQVTGLKIPGKVTGITWPPGKVKGVIVTGIIKPPKVPGVIITGIIKPPHVPGVWIPPVTGVIVTPPTIAVLPPEEVTYTKRRYSWYAGNTEVAARPAVSTAEAPCNCLTKEYLQDGSVLFKDLCTKEAAVLTVEEMKAKHQGAQNQ